MYCFFLAVSERDGGQWAILRHSEVTLSYHYKESSVLNPIRRSFVSPLEGKLLLYLLTLPSYW